MGSSRLYCLHDVMMVFRTPKKKSTPGDKKKSTPLEDRRTPGSAPSQKWKSLGRNEEVFYTAPLIPPHGYVVCGMWDVGCFSVNSVKSEVF